MKVVTIGGATKDIFIQTKNIKTSHLQNQSYIILEEGKKLEVQGLAYHSGGGATNTAVSFKRLGFTIESLFKIGNDHEGNFILCELKNEGVLTNNVIKTSREITGTSFIIPSPSGNRTILVYRGANLTLQKDEVPKQIISECDQLYITSLSGQASDLLPPITALAAYHTIPVAVNPGSSQLVTSTSTLVHSLPNIDILILNAFEASLLMYSFTQKKPELKQKNSKNKVEKYQEKPILLQKGIIYKNMSFALPHFFHEVLTRGPKIVVVTNGADGVYVATQKQILFHRSLSTKIISTVGAGDAFGSCFVASLAQGTSINEALVRGLINATSVIGSLDAKTNLLTQEQLENRLQKIGIGQTQNFPI